MFVIYLRHGIYFCMSLKPSSALLAMYKKDCHDACCKSYWWSYKAAVVASQRWDCKQCVKKCVRDTIEKERRLIMKKQENGKVKNLNI